MQAWTFDLETESEMRRLGARLAPFLARGDVVALEGPLGAGKTTLARGVIEAFAGVRDAPSPSYALVEIYPGPAFPLWHVDLYRLTGPEEARELGLEQAFDEGACLIEWPDRLGPALPGHALRIKFTTLDAARRLHVSGGGDWPDRLGRVFGAGSLGERRESPHRRRPDLERR
jgi:tRNA threonylcarbamoyladenosine biosynthesis protein TsaE